MPQNSAGLAVQLARVLTCIAFLPAQRCQEWRLLFSSAKHGQSFSTFMGRWVAEHLCNVALRVVHAAVCTRFEPAVTCCKWPLPCLRHRCSDKGATLVLVKDKGGAIFGGFAATPWQRHGDFFGQ